MYEIYYKKTSTDLLVTVCPIKGCKVGGWKCTQCQHFSGKNMKRQRVKCSLNHDLKNETPRVSKKNSRTH